MIDSIIDKQNGVKFSVKLFDDKPMYTEKMNVNSRMYVSLINSSE